jgi:hypothetical protein
MFQGWLRDNGHKQITVLKPEGRFKTILEECQHYSIVPHMRQRWCTVYYKIKVVEKYYEKPCFQHLGIDAGESHRAKIAVSKGIENRWLLIEYDIDRDGCKDLIKKNGLPVPKKSGCWFCPMQKKSQWQELRRKHPCLFKQAVDLEKANMEYAKKKR